MEFPHYQDKTLFAPDYKIIAGWNKYFIAAIQACPISKNTYDQMTNTVRSSHDIPDVLKSYLLAAQETLGNETGAQ